MIVTPNPMSAIELVETLAGEHLVLPGLIVETIKENAGLWATVKSYGKGTVTYERVSESLANYL